MHDRLPPCVIGSDVCSLKIESLFQHFYWLLDQSSCTAVLPAACQRSGEACRATTLGCVKDSEAARGKSCRLSTRVHETGGFGPEVVTQAESGSFWLHLHGLIEGDWQDRKSENTQKADAHAVGVFGFFFIIILLINLT